MFIRASRLFLLYEGNKKILNQDYTKIIWTLGIRDPGLIRSIKRGKKVGVRVRHSTCNSKVLLPAIVLTNARSIYYKLDKLHGLLKTKRLHNLYDSVNPLQNEMSACLSVLYINSSVLNEFCNTLRVDNKVPQLHATKSVPLDYMFAINYTITNPNLLSIKEKFSGRFRNQFIFKAVF